MEDLNIINFEAQYTDKVKSLLATVLQYLDLPEAQPFLPNVTYDDSDLDRIAEVYVKRSRFWLAVISDEVIGMVAIEEVDATTALLRRMFVAPNHHGKKVGQRLLDTALEFAETQGFQTIKLDTHNGMRRAHAFYEKYGFRRTAEDERQRHYSIDLVQGLLRNAEGRSEAVNTSPASGSTSAKPAEDKRARKDCSLE